MLTGREKRSESFAPILTDKDIRNMYWYREEEAMEYYYAGTDMVYSLRRCTERQLKKIDMYSKYRDTWYGRLCRSIHKCIEQGKNRTKTASIYYDCIWENVVIYGAGKKGRLLYDQLTGRKKVNGRRYHCNVVIWVDRNYLQYREQGMDIVAPEEIYNTEFEQIIIAVAKKEIADDIKRMLLRKGIEDYKIMWINPVG